MYAYLEDIDGIASSASTNNTGYVKIEGLLPWNDYKMCCTPVPLRGTGIYCHKKDPPTKTLPGGESVFIYIENLKSTAIKAIHFTKNEVFYKIGICEVFKAICWK